MIRTRWIALVVASLMGLSNAAVSTAAHAQQMQTYPVDSWERCEGYAFVKYTEWSDGSVTRTQIGNCI